ncbi:MAG: putative lipoprotein [Segetibacter sp.]|nr:putative lipoprotein [Segetibacter sp.]
MYRMKISIYALGLIVVASVSSCANAPDYNYSKGQSNAVVLPFNKQEKVTNNSANQAVFQSGANVNSSAALPGVALNPAHGQPGHRCEVAVGAPLNAPAPPQQVQPVNNILPQQQKPAATYPSAVPGTSSPSSVGLNPAHGVAGHRCDIAVGAPLNTPVAASAQQKQPLVSQPQVQKPAPVLTSATAATSSKSSAGLNPAHGIKGHRCDIAVGASLNSPAPSAATQKQPEINTQPAVQTPTAMYPTISPSASAKGTARLNPAHGQPGHDCAVAVGQPLK